MRGKSSNFLKRHWRFVVTFITVSALFILVYALRHQILDTLKSLDDVNYWWLLLMIPLLLLNYEAYARMYYSILNHLGQTVRYKSMYRVTAELNFVNHVFPSGGITGISYFGIRLRQYGVRAGTATIIQLIKFVMLFISFQVLIAIGLLALAFDGKTSNLIILIAGVLATLTLVGTFALAYVVGSKSRINAFFTTLTNFLNGLIHLVRPKHPETINIAKAKEAMTDMHDNYVLLQKDFRVVRTVFLLALLANITEVLSVYVVYVAFGELVNVGAVILAYAIANFAGLISVLPGGIGIYEALMTAVLAAGGVPAALSIPVVVMYRVLSITFHVVPGWILYHRAIHAKNP